MTTRRGWWCLGVALAMAGCSDVEVGSTDGGPTVREPPACPMGVTSDPSDTGSRTFALRGWQLDQTAGGAWKEIGYDLDGFDTGADGTPGECIPEWPSADGEDGIDNRFGEAVWPVLRSVLPSLECELDQAAAAGHGTLLIQISQWNGTADDASVRVSLVRALDGTSGSTDCQDFDADGELLDGPGGPTSPPPQWAGFDAFCVNPDSLTNDSPIGAPVFVDPSAYLCGGVLVARIPETADWTLETARSSLPMRLGDGILVAELDAVFTEITGGVVTGRNSIFNLIDVGLILGTCNPEDLVSVYELYADIRAETPGAPTPASSCDAVSMALAFTGVIAEVAGSAPVAVPPARACAPVTGELVTPWPVLACCDALAVSNVVTCYDYWDAMP